MEIWSVGIFRSCSCNVFQYFIIQGEKHIIGIFKLISGLLLYQDTHMIKTLNSPLSEFSLSQSLLYLCKKPSPGSPTNPQIDFLLLDQQIEDLQHIQSKTCQQIVEFVDEHRQQFIKINHNFKNIEHEITSTESILKNLIPQIVEYKQKHYSSENKIQEFITNYEKQLIKNKLLDLAKEEAMFLIDFVKEFQNFINLNIEDLSHWHKYYIARFLKKLQYLKSLLGHPMAKAADQEYHGIDNLLDNICQQVEFYLSEQLSRLIFDEELRNRKHLSQFTLLEEMKTWYEYSNKLQIFYQTVQQAILCRQMPTLQSLLITNKQTLLLGKQQTILNHFYKTLFLNINKFPQEHPIQRILHLVYKFLNKKQLNFQFSYIVPTFVSSYNSYQNNLHYLVNEEIKQQMRTHHNWKLSLWAELRIKSIMDRSGKDFNLKLQGVLVKWMDIIFKKGFMIKGTKNYMIRLAMMLANKYCLQFEEKQFGVGVLNQSMKQIREGTEILNRKIRQGFEEEYLEQINAKKEQNQIINEQETVIEQHIKQVIQNIQNSLKNSLKQWLHKHFTMITKNCCSSLENYKSFIMKIVNNKKQYRSKTEINKKENILKPLIGFIKNNAELSEESIGMLEAAIWSNVEKYYDTEYARDVYNHCLNSLTTEQMKTVMEVLSLERSSLFDTVPQNSTENKTIE